MGAADPGLRSAPSGRRHYAQLSGVDLTPFQQSCSLPPIKPDFPLSTQDGECVAVVSRLGEKFTVKRVGIIAFQNEKNDLPIDAWRIDDLIVAKISGFLNKRAVMERIPYQKGAFASLDRSYLATPIRRTDHGTPRCQAKADGVCRLMAAGPGGSARLRPKPNVQAAPVAPLPPCPPAC